MSWDGLGSLENHGNGERGAKQPKKKMESGSKMESGRAQIWRWDVGAASLGIKMHKVTAPRLGGLKEGLGWTLGLLGCLGLGWTILGVPPNSVRSVVVSCVAALAEKEPTPGWARPAQ